MNLLPARFRSQEVERSSPVEYSLDDWIAYVNEFVYNGNGYLTTGVNQTMPGQRQESIGPAYSALSWLAYKTDSVVFACMQTRAQHFAQVRFQWRRLSNGRPGDLFGNADLQPLETPWEGGTTQDLLTKMIQHVDLGGNAFVVRRGDGLSLLRPDWVTIIIGSNTDPKLGAWATDADILGYVYSPGGYAGADAVETETYLAEEVAHFAPTPDPMARFRGMSWLTPLIREVMADKAATEHKLRFFEHPTPNAVVKFDVADLEEYKAQVAAFKEAHMGSQNAWKWMFATMGVDFTTVGSNMQDLDYRLITGAGETRIAAAARTPPVLVGLSEGLQGSSLNAGNYQAARRHFVDETIRYLWANAAGSLSKIMAVPGGAEFWYDERDVAFLKEDIGERADVELKKAQTIRFLVDAGYLPETVIQAVDSEDLSLLEHSGLYSVQLQPAGAPKQGLFTGVPVPIGQTPGGPPQTSAPGGGVPPSGIPDYNAPKPNGSAATGRSLDMEPYARTHPAETHIHFEDGAFRFVPNEPSRIEVNVPEQPINVTVEAGEPPRVEFADGAIRVENAAPEVNIDLEPIADGLRALADAKTDVHVDAPITVQPADVRVEAPAIEIPAQEPPVVNVTVESPRPRKATAKRGKDGTIEVDYEDPEK